MKRTNMCVLSASLAVALSACAMPNTVWAETVAPETASQPSIAAHRGGAMHRPENTISAFDHAIELGVDVLEFDMVMTSDDELIVHHDATINPDICIPDPSSDMVAGPVRGLTLQQTQQFDCGTKVRDIYAVEGHVAVPGARIPTVDELLGRFRSKDVVFYAETKMPKPTPGIADVDPVTFATLVDAVVRAHGLQDRLILQSSDYRTIDALHTINPRIRTCLLGAHNWGHRDFLTTLQQHHATCILLRDSIVGKEDVRALQDAGVQVYSEVVDTPEAWRRYLDLGVDVLFTNHPEGAIKFVERQGQ
ncbi:MULTISPECIES: glycerophosphodiester phosphodiesterase [unclassified Lysobacter]